MRRAGDVQMGPDNLRVHVAHYTRFVERRIHLENQLALSGLVAFEPGWIEEFDREEILTEYEKGVYGNPSVINASVVSVILKHLRAFKAAAESEVPYHLVLEDDVVIPRDFLGSLMVSLRQMPDDWEILFVGDGCNLRIPFWRRRTGKDVYFRGWKKTWWGGAGTARCAAAYVIRPGFARRFLENPKSRPPFGDTAIDWLMAEVGYELKIRSYWSEPPLIRQGAFESWTKDKRLMARTEN